MVSSISATHTAVATPAERNRAFAGSHCLDDGTVINVFFATFDGGSGYYWCKVVDGMCRSPIGPFPTAEGAYLSAIGD